MAGTPARHREEAGARVNIWTERLERGHLPLLGRWLGRADAALTPNDLPAEAVELEAWFERCAAEPGRLDFLTLVYETPVGLASLRPGGEDGSAALELLLGERNYNPLRTATYVALRMLDRTFLECGFRRVSVQAFTRHAWLLEPLERMGFSRTAEQGDRICLTVEKDCYLSRKYLF